MINAVSGTAAISLTKVVACSLQPARRLQVAGMFRLLRYAGRLAGSAALRLPNLICIVTIWSVF
jgi:hypothetical protein